MKINVGKYSGFCFGVRRAVETVENAVVNGKIYTLGEIIHNETVVEMLAQKGAVPIDSIDNAPERSEIVTVPTGLAVSLRTGQGEGRKTDRRDLPFCQTHPQNCPGARTEGRRCRNCRQLQASRSHGNSGVGRGAGLRRLLRGGRQAAACRAVGLHCGADHHQHRILSGRW